jgi:hypothetical protein
MSTPENPLRNFAFSAPNLYHEASRSTAIDEPVPAVVITKEGALALMDRTFETCDQSLFVPMMRAITDAEDAVVLGIMRGSENEMDLFGKAMDLRRERGITTLRDSLAFIAREKAIRAAEAA